MKPTIISIFTASLFSLANTGFAEDTAWGYTGRTSADHWAALSPDYRLCASGKNQSPINIDFKKALDFQNQGIKFNYGHITPLKIYNMDNVIRITVDKGTNIQVDGMTFELKHLDIHMASEHTFNKQHHPMEIEFFHENANKEIAIVSMMAVAGHADRTLRKILAQMPQKGESKTLADNTLRSIEMKKKLADYTRYNGSLTTPPCTEGVRWFILKQALTISSEQQQQFQAVLGHANNRPIQDTNARMVFK